MSLLVLALAAAPQAVPGLDPGHLATSPTTWVRTAGTPRSGGACTPLANGGFHNGLFGWDTAASAPAPGGVAGTVEATGGVATLLENGSFLTTLSQGVCVPADTVALTFDLVSVDLETGAGFIPDAFEVSLLDGSATSVVTTWSPAATSFFNVQEDGSMFMGPGVSTAAAAGALLRVRVDLAALAPALATRDDLTLYFDLVGPDGDTGSQAIVDNVILEGGSPGTAYCTGVDCPCGNDAPGRGCLNSSGEGGLLEALGSASLAADDLTLRASGLTLNFACLLLAEGEACTAIGDGYMAVNPGLYQTGILRGAVQLVQPDGTVAYGPGVVSLVEGNLGAPGLITAGTTWYFQVAYRDEPTSPCGNRFNLTNGLRITFQS